MHEVVRTFSKAWWVKFVRAWNLHPNHALLSGAGAIALVVQDESDESAVIVFDSVGTAVLQASQVASSLVTISGGRATWLKFVQKLSDPVQLILSGELKSSVGPSWLVHYLPGFLLVAEVATSIADAME